MNIKNKKYNKNIWSVKVKSLCIRDNDVYTYFGEKNYYLQNGSINSSYTLHLRCTSHCDVEYMHKQS